MANLASLEDVDRVIEVLCERGYARRSARRPGQKEDRFEHLLGSDQAEEPVGPEEPMLSAEPAPAADDGLPARVAALESQVEELRQELAALREQAAV
jgi:uncharacterized protein YceH (UPF0502 family)